MSGWEIKLCDDITCRYSTDVGCFTGQIEWAEGCICDLFLVCNPDKPIDMLLIKLAFETIYRERETWTRKAVDCACRRFIPYFRYVSWSKNDRMEEVLPEYLIPCSIEFRIDGRLEIGFQTFYIGSRESDLFVSGKVGIGFTSVKDGCNEIPIV